MTSPRSAPMRRETGAGNDSRVWIRGWLRKIPLSGMAGRSPRPGLGSAGSDLSAQGSSKAERLSRGARGMRLIASSACSGPVPLPPGLPELANWPPITPRSSPQAGNPKYPPASPLGRERCSTDGVCQNRKSFPAPRPHQVGFCERRCRISMRSFRPRAGLPRCWRARNRASA